MLPLVPDSLSEPEARASMLGDVTCHIKSCSIRFDSKQEPTVCARCSAGLVAGCCKKRISCGEPQKPVDFVGFSLPRLGPREARSYATCMVLAKQC